MTFLFEFLLYGFTSILYAPMPSYSLRPVTNIHEVIHSSQSNCSIKSHVCYPHIEGLRALAIIPVLIFHLRQGIFKGGFTGVDVFFGISGFLIVGGIFKELN